MSEETVKVELELPKEVYDFLLLSLGSENEVKAYLMSSIADNIRSDFEALQGGGFFAETLHKRFKEAIFKSLEGWRLDALWIESLLR